MGQNVAAEAIEELAGQLLASETFRGGLSPLLKADSFSGGTNGQQLVWYDLEPTVKLLYPFIEQIPLIAGDAKKGIAPLPRVPANGGTATHWKTVTAINTKNLSFGVGRGQRGATITVQTNDMNAPFYGMGLESAVDFETVYEGGGNLNPDSLALAVQSALRSVMIQEEQALIWGNSSLALGTTPTPTVVDGAATGGSITQGGSTLSVICVALAGEGALYDTVAGGVNASIARQNADGSTLTYGGGSAQKSAAGTLSLTASHTALVTVTPVSGAVGYAWFWGAAGAETLGAITSLAGIELKADAAGTQLASALPASDNSKNGFIPDGIITQMAGTSFGSASNSYIKVQANGTGAGSAAGTVGAGNGLTADGAGGIVEFDVAFQDRYDKYRLGFTRIFISSQETNNLVKKILSQPAGVTSLFRGSYMMPTGGGEMSAGFRITSYHNKWTGQDVDVVTHPWVPAGTVIFWSDRVPYALSNVGNIIQAKVRQGYYQLEWPLSTRQYQFGVYTDETFENYFTPAFGMITNLGNN